MPDLASWQTAVTHIAPGEIAYRSVPVQDVVERADLAEAVWLVLFGPGATTGQVDALRRAVAAALDHGVTAPSTLSARAVASTRGPLPLAIAAGLIAFAGPAHGGAAEGAAELFVRLVAAPDLAAAASDAVRETLARGERIPGYGHPYHPVDPRVAPLMAGVEPRRAHRDAATAVEDALVSQRDRPLAMNADAAVAALLLDVGLEPWDVTLVTALGRTVGLAAHAREERVREKPFRAPGLDTVTYRSTDEEPT